MRETSKVFKAVSSQMHLRHDSTNRGKARARDRQERVGRGRFWEALRAEEQREGFPLFFIVFDG